MSEEGRYDCLISGKIEVALILGPDGGPLFTMAADANHLSAAKELDMPEFLKQADDWLRLNGLILDEIREQLDLIVAVEDAFTLIINCLEQDNSAVEGDVAKEMDRDELFGEVNEMLADQRVYEQLLNVLCVHPLTKEDGLESTILSADTENLWDLSAILEIIWINQPRIRQICKAWEYPNSLFRSEEERRSFRAAAIYAGLFRLLMLGKTDEHLEQAMADPKLPRHHCLRQVIAAWREKLTKVIVNEGKD